MIRHTRGFAGGRRVSAPGDAMNRLWAVEAVFSITGANADHRLRLPTRLIPGFVAALAAELKKGGLAIDAAAAPEVPGLDAAWLHALAEDLLANRGTSVIVAGPRQPAAVHAAVVALNAALGNVRATVDVPRADGRAAAVAGRLRGARRRPARRQGGDARRAGRQSRLRRAGRPRLEGGGREGRGARPLRQPRRRDRGARVVARPERALPRVLGRRARALRHAERRAAADPAALRRRRARSSWSRSWRAAKTGPATTSSRRPGAVCWARPTSRSAGTACSTTACCRRARSRA